MPQAPDACEGARTDPEPVVVSRLTRDEYVRTIVDLFGVDVSEAAEGLPFEIRAPFTTTSVAQTTDIRHVEVFAEVAERVADGLGDFSQDYVDCRDFGQACRDALIARLGRKVFRRPLRDAEVHGLRPLFDVVANEGGGFEEAARLLLRALLQSPQFLYHLEDRRGDGVHPLSPYELANRLSYLVWHSGPDPALLAAAEEGRLTTPDQIEAQIRRLAADPRAAQASLTFFEDWMDLTRLERAVSGIDDGTKAQMRQETEQLVLQVLWSEDGSLVDLIDAPYTFATPELAQRYGLQSRGDGWQRYPLEDVADRQGILTHASLLAAHANGNRPAFVSRGLFLLRTFLCRDVPDPPAGVDTNETSLPETASERQMSAERLDRGGCAGCHVTFDPLAYAFEGYDGGGRRIERDRHGNPVRSDGWVPKAFSAEPGTPEGTDHPYSDVKGLVDVLAEAPFVRTCLSQKPFGFALRRELGSGLADACAVAEVTERAESLGGSYVDLLVAIATHPMFTRIDRSETGS